MKIKTYPVAFLWSVIKPYKYNEKIIFAQSYKPIIWFVAAQAILDGAWRAHNFAQLKAMPHIFQGMMNKICNHCFNLAVYLFSK
ncbi:hypothetical protein [Rickettsia slovaca]|uniref:hypothetical protein n=1 Tax=Rickettsia slovaca TaxID=35794 RepID=UPI00031140F7|nr:hypothetical protein [Rickettsia slovaca]